MPVFLGTFMAIIAVFFLMGKLHKLGRGPRRVFGHMLAPRNCRHYPRRHGGCGPSCGCATCKADTKGAYRRKHYRKLKLRFRRKQYARMEKATTAPPRREMAPVRSQLPQPPASTAPPSTPVPATGGPVNVTPWPSRAPFDGCYS